MPLRPARPLIWMYSPGVIQRKVPPSYLRVWVKTTVRAGMLSPVEKVSVAKRACMWHYSIISAGANLWLLKTLMKVQEKQSEMCHILARVSEHRRSRRHVLAC